MLTTAGDLITSFRREMKDKVEPFFWEDAQLLEFAADGQNRVAEETRCLADTLEVDVDPETGLVTIPDTVIRLRSATLPNGQELEFCRLGQRHAARALVLNETSSTARVEPAPLSATTLLLHVYRYPCALDNKGSRVEVPVPYRTAVVFWMRHRALLVQDAETFDYAKAQDYRALFEAEIRDGMARQGRRNRSFGGVQYQDI